VTTTTKTEQHETAAMRRGTEQEALARQHYEGATSGPATPTYNPVLQETERHAIATAPHPPVQVMPAQQQTPATWVDNAIRQGVPPDQLRMLMDLWKEWKAELRREAFAAAVAAFHATNPVVVKDKRNDQYGSYYTTLGNLVQSVSQELGRQGLSVSWDPDNTAEEGWVTITCTLQHAAGYSKTTSVRLPNDESGKKNPLQEIKSAITYGRALTFENVLGLAAIAEANLDDDGNAAGVPRGEAGGRQRQGGGDNAGKEKLLDAGRNKALEGMTALTKWWSLLSSPERSLITPDFAHMKKAARIADEEKERGGAA